MNEIRINYEEEKEVWREDGEKKDGKIAELERDCQELSEEVFVVSQQVNAVQAEVEELRQENEDKYMVIESLESQLIQLTQANSNYQGRTI